MTVSNVHQLISLQFASLFRSNDQLCWWRRCSLSVTSLRLLPKNCAKRSFWPNRHVDNMLLWTPVHRDNVSGNW